MKTVKRIFSFVISASLLVAIASCFSPYFVPTCFLPGTLISTPSGQLPIEELKLGQTVYSYDEESKEIVEAVVEQTYSHEVDEYIELDLDNDRSLLVTPEHPIALQGENGGIKWVEAGSLEQGAIMVSINVEAAEKVVGQSSITDVRWVDAPVTVYNIKVRRYRNSFAEGVLTHFYFETLDQKNAQE